MKNNNNNDFEDADPLRAIDVVLASSDEAPDEDAVLFYKSLKKKTITKHF